MHAFFRGGAPIQARGGHGRKGEAPGAHSARNKFRLLFCGVSGYADGMSKMQFSLVRQSDIPQILEIYSPFIRDTAVTFELEPPGTEAFAERARRISERFPYIVCREAERVAGYAYAAPHNDRGAYQWNASLSIYMRPEFSGRGLGGRLYGVLLEMLKRLGYKNLYALITLPNEASLALHEKFGFTQLAVMRKTGCKFGRWHDVAMLEKCLGEHGRDPAPPRLVSGLSPEEEREILAGPA